MLEHVKDTEHFGKIVEKNAEYCVLLFTGAFSDAARRALSEMTEFAEEYPDVPVCAIDVMEVKGLHERHGVTEVPTAVVLKNGKEIDRIEGVESAAFYALRFAGTAPRHIARPTRKKPRRVTVYSGPGCPACGQLKTYLRTHGVHFTEVDISRNQQAAEKLMRKTGYQAVPQTDINGRIVVGFDRNKLAALLGINNTGRA